MLRPLVTLKIPEAIRLKLHELGFYFCEDIIVALKKDPPKGLLSVIEKYDLMSQFEVPKIMSAVDLWQKECLEPSISIFHKELDCLLKGGLPITRITELCGTPGSGKSQICLQFCIDVQVPSLFGGSEGQTLYICTDNSFRAERLKEIADSSIQHWNNIAGNFENNESLQNLTVDNLLKGVHVILVIDYENLLNILSDLSNYLKLNRKIKLIVIDSFSMPFVCALVDNLIRTKLIYQALDMLQNLANRYKLAIVVTNQFTTVVTSNSESKLIPSLGESFGHRIHQRIFLGDKKAYLVKSIGSSQLITSFDILKSGIR